MLKTSIFKGKQKSKQLADQITLEGIIESTPLFSAQAVRVAGDTGCERIPKEKKMQTTKFYSLPEIGKGLGGGEMRQH